MPNPHSRFDYDVFLSHSAKDQTVVRAVAERLRKDRVRVWFDEWMVKPGDSIPATIEEGLEHSRVMVLCISANVLGSDWVRLEPATFRFRDPLNRERRFLFLRLDDTPIKGPFAQFVYVNWFPPVREQDYATLLEACRPPIETGSSDATNNDLKTFAERRFRLDYILRESQVINDCVFDLDGERAITGADDNTLRLWNLGTGKCLRVYQSHKDHVLSVAWSNDRRRILSGACGGDAAVRLWDLETAECLRTLEGHSINITSLAFSADGRLAASGGDVVLETEPFAGRIWDLEKGTCLHALKEHRKGVYSLEFSHDGHQLLTGSLDGSLLLWDVESGCCLRTLEGHTDNILSVEWSADDTQALTASSDRTLRLWDLKSGRNLRVLEGHTDRITSSAWCSDMRHVLSGSHDGTLRLWNVKTGRCLLVINDHAAEIIAVAWSAASDRAISGDEKGGICVWNLSEFVSERLRRVSSPPLRLAVDQIEYTNAKVLVVGDTNAGKTGLTHRLATGEWKPSDGSTVGAWSTQWQLKDIGLKRGVDQEIWLWDFGGQADQRLIHQLYMDRTALILLLFNADQEDVLPGLRDWQTALRRCMREKIPHFLVAGRIDTGFKASRGKLQAFAQEQDLSYHETSAKTGQGCDELRAAMIAEIPWTQVETRTSPRIFKLIKDEILKLRDEGQVLHTFKELRELLWRRLPDEPRFTDDTLQTVIGLLDGPGVVKELYYGTYILLAPEWINAYGQAVIRTLRSAENDLGVLPLRSIADGKLIYQSIGRDGAPVEMRRLPPAEERVVLGEMERQLEQRGLCLRQGDKLVFPSHCGRDRPGMLEHPSIFVSYAVKGYLDDTYATLVVKLADSQSFTLKELWRDAADFVTLVGDHHMGIKLARDSGSEGNISVYFGPGVAEAEQVIFANYIHAHLEDACEKALRLRHYVCPKCNAAKGNPEVLMKKLLAKKQKADTECDGCGERFPLWDALEKRFASDQVHKQVEHLQAEDALQLDSRRKGKLLALEVSARITSADQKCFEIPATEDEGLDMELEFTNDDGEGTGHRLYLQLKSGNSHLTKRKADGVEIFAIKKQRWVEYWLQQPHPVMLVIGTFDDEDEPEFENEKREFADVRWMEISDVLRRESQNGKKPVRQIEFKGERLDLSSVRRWRERVLQSSRS